MIRKLIAFAVTAVLSSQALSQEANIKEKIESTIGFEVDAVAESPVKGLYEVVTDRGLFYVSADSTYLLQARVYNLDKGLKDETEIALGNVRKDVVSALADSAIVFKADNEKHVISVFTDVDCGYCRKLHSEIGSLNDLGITVRYMAFPRAGLDSETYQQMVSVWCSDDPKTALTEAKAGEKLALKSCENSVAEHYKMGKKMGVSGTPNIVLPNGELIPGYAPAKEIAKTLNQIG